MLTEQRRDLIVSYVNDRGSVTLADLKEMLGASESTLRRDIAALDEEGRVSRVFGGAVRADGDTITAQEYSVEEKSIVNIAEKSKVGRYAASLIDSWDCVYIDAGTTTGAMIDYIEKSPALFVTNAFSHARRLSAKGCRVILIGGEVKATTEAVVGPTALEMIERYHFTKGFFGVNGVTRKSGCTTPDSNEAAIKRKAVAMSKEKYVLCDYSKFGQISPVTYADFQAVTIIADDKTTGYENCDNVIIVE